MSRLILALIMSVFLLTGQLALADTPQLINYQGILSDSYGQPLSGGYYLMFTIYNAPSDPSSILWQEGRTVTVSNGLFNVTLGSIVPLSDTVFNDTGRYLGIRIGTGEPEISPRTPLVSSPYAFRVKTIDGATGGDIYGDVTLHSVFEIVDDALFNLRDVHDNITIVLDAQDGPGGGAMAYLADDDGTQTIWMDAQADETYGGALVYLGEDDGTITIVLNAQDGGYGGADVILKNGFGTHTIEFDGDDAGDWGGIIKMFDADSTKTVHLDACGTGTALGGAQLSLCDSAGTTTISLDAQSGSAGGACITLTDGSIPATTTVTIDGNYGGTNKGWVITDVLEIKGGADLSEQFEVRSDLSDQDVAPGMVVCIDPENPGKLVLSSKAYDPTVAGVISGAGGIQPGMLMGQTGSISDGQHAVALTGRVYCQADASYGAIRPGDFLTTSATPGHAMRATDRNRAYGTVIGKAMTGLEKDTGLVLVLVNLQ